MQSALAGMSAGVVLQLLRRNSHANEMGSDRAERAARPRVSLSRIGGRSLMLPMGIACGALIALLAYALLVATLVGRAADTTQRDAFLMHVHPYLFLVPVRTSSGWWLLLALSWCFSFSSSFCFSFACRCSRSWRCATRWTRCAGATVRCSPGSVASASRCASHRSN